MYVSDSSHGNKWQIVEEPANCWVDTSIVDLVNVPLAELAIASLPTDQIPDDNESYDAERGCRAPVDDWIAKKEVFGNVVLPRAHAKADIEDGPLPELRR